MSCEFYAFNKRGEKTGLTVEEYTSQRDFLLSCGIRKKIKTLDKTTMNLLDYNSELNGLNRLIDERGLGNIKVNLYRRRINPGNRTLLIPVLHLLSLICVSNSIILSFLFYNQIILFLK